MKESELRTRAKTFALKLMSMCDQIDTRKDRGVLINQIALRKKYQKICCKAVAL